MNKQTLSKPRQQLVELMSEIHYGSIENLTIHDCEPILRPAPRIVRDVMLGKRETKRPKKSPEDFVLKAQHEDLFEQLDELRDGKIDRIEIQAGLPFRIRLAAAA
jgi:hypothetical protein